MKKTLSILILLIAFCELKAQNKQYEFNVEKPDVGVDIIIDEYLVVGWKRELKFTTKNKSKQYRFTFTHGTIEQKEQLLLLNPNKTGEGIIKVYELIEKKYLLVKEVVVDVFEIPARCFGEKCFYTIEDNINDTTTLGQPFTIKFVNDTKEIVVPVYRFKFSWVCNDTIYEQKIAGNIVGTRILRGVYNNCNNINIYIEDIYYKHDKGNLAKTVHLILNYSNPETELK